MGGYVVVVVSFQQFAYDAENAWRYVGNCFCPCGFRIYERGLLLPFSIVLENNHRQCFGYRSQIKALR